MSTFEGKVSFLPLGFRLLVLLLSSRVTMSCCQPLRAVGVRKWAWRDSFVSTTGSLFRRPSPPLPQPSNTIGNVLISYSALDIASHKTQATCCWSVANSESTKGIGLDSSWLTASSYTTFCEFTYAWISATSRLIQYSLISIT